MENTAAISALFRRIAPRYDLMNRLMTWGQDLRWRRAASRLLLTEQPERLLDLAAGTGDFASIASHLIPSLREVYLVDITPEMLAYAPSKKPHREGLHWHIEVADAHSLPFPENFFDAVTVGYGMRNFSDRPQALREIYRVLRPNGMALILETGIPTSPLWKAIFWVYFRFYVPFLGRVLTRDREAYVYLPESTAAFPHRESFVYLCKEAGFSSVTYDAFWGGASILYKLRKDA
ncbi:MAG: ubiquinone/menaquinone biosynthesis methyltransferase [Bacteroidia bacterium]|nr:ubiquinone/menaquinone biosynthesis methyltransferase [Bacteroidia bacterium]